MTDKTQVVRVHGTDLSCSTNNSVVMHAQRAFTRQQPCFPIHNTPSMLVLVNC